MGQLEAWGAINEELFTGRAAVNTLPSCARMQQREALYLSAGEGLNPACLSSLLEARARDARFHAGINFPPLQPHPDLQLRLQGASPDTHTHTSWVAFSGRE